MDEAMAADVERARRALELATEMTPPTRRWLLDQLVTACALDQEGIAWKVGPERTPASSPPDYGLCDHGVPVNHRCYACEPRIGHLERVDPPPVRPLSERTHDADGT